MVPVEAGPNRVKITFVRTWDRVVGGWVSLVTALLVMLWVAFVKARIRNSDLATGF
jgi:hypothetical protein